MENNSPEKKWYAVYTRPNAEKKVYQQLILNGFEAYLPLVSSIRKWSDRKKRIESPLISLFVFVKTDESKIYSVLNAKGSIRILKYLGKPAIIKNDEIENIRILMNDASNVKVIDYEGIGIGEEVTVVKGPFMGLRANSLVIKGKTRIIVRFETLGSAMQVELPLSFIVKRGRI